MGGVFSVGEAEMVGGLGKVLRELVELFADGVAREGIVGVKLDELAKGVEGHRHGGECSGRAFSWTRVF